MPLLVTGRVGGYHPLYKTFEQLQLVNMWVVFYKKTNLVSSVLLLTPSFHLISGEFSLIFQSWS